MRKYLSIAGCLVLLGVGAAMVTAAEEGSNEARPVSKSAMALRAAEVRLVLDNQRSVQAALEEEYRAAPDETVSLEVQKRMEDLARATELSILGIHADFLRAAGQVVEAEAIEEAVKEMMAPATKRVPVERPRPDADKGAR